MEFIDREGNTWNTDQLGDIESHGIESIEELAPLFQDLNKNGYEFIYWITHPDLYNSASKSWSMISVPTEDRPDELKSDNFYATLFDFFNEITNQLSDGKYRLELVEEEPFDSGCQEN